MLRLNGLAQFLAVCATRNLTAAAEIVGVSQPALTQTIARLERQLGVTLFDRTTRPLKLTAAGEVLEDYARAQERQDDELRARLEAVQSGTGGLLRIGCGPDWIHSILPRAIAALHRDRPGVRVDLTVALNDALRSDLDAGRLDIFFASISDVYFGPAYETRILLRDRMRIVARRDHPVHAGQPKTLEALARESWVMTGDATFGRQLMRHVFGQAGLPMPVPSIETNSVRAMINLLREAPHLGFLSATHTDAYPDILGVETAMDLPTREGGATWRRDAPLPAAAEHLLAQVEAVIADG